MGFFFLQQPFHLLIKHFFIFIFKHSCQSAYLFICSAISLERGHKGNSEIQWNIETYPGNQREMTLHTKLC